MSDLITIKGIHVSESGYNAAPNPIGCPGHDDGTNCEDDEQNPCKACFLYDEKEGESRYWWDDNIVWHVTIPAIALVRAETPEEAEEMVAGYLERAGFTAYEDNRRVEAADFQEDAYLYRPPKWER